MAEKDLLEVHKDVNNFIIKGNYSFTINKNDPLGIILSELLSDTNSIDFSASSIIRSHLAQYLREKSSPSIGKSLSSRGKAILKREDPATNVYIKMNSNRYSPENRTGNINLCTAENAVCTELVTERFQKNPEIFVPNYSHITRYGPPGGYLTIKSAICQYLRETHSTIVDERNIVLLPSGNATIDLLSHSLLDNQDVILTSAPTYTRNFVNVAERANCQLVPVDMDLSNLHIDISEYERVYIERTKKGEKVKAVLVINPNNPMGIIFPLEDIKKLICWAEGHGLWTIVDESFSQCIHDPEEEFKSFIKQQMTLSAKTVWFWSLSKDFGLPGVKLSVVQTNDRELHHVLSHLELTFPVSGLAQDFIANFLSNKVWLEKFKDEKYQRLRAHYKFTTENLQNLGIPFQPAPAAIFVFVNFGEKLSSSTFEAENELWESLASKGIFMTPGSYTRCPQPGWMRLVFACDKDQLQEAFRRLYEFFDSSSSIVGEISY